MANSTVLAIIQDFTARRGLPTPAALVGTTTKDAKQYIALLNAIFRDLARYNLPEQRVRKTFTASGSEDQGLLTTVFGSDFRSLVANTMWDDDAQVQIRGPVTEQEWQIAKTSVSVGAITLSWIAGGHLYLFPALTAGTNLSAIYTSEYGVRVTGTGAPAALITDDTDTSAYSDDLIHKGLDFFWNKAKGESWNTEYEEYIGLIGDAKAKNSSIPLQLDSGERTVRPGIVLPSGYSTR